MLRWRKGGYIKEAVWDIAKNKVPVGRKISTPNPPVFWVSLVSQQMAESLRVWCSWCRNHPKTLSPWAFEVQVATARLLRSSSLQQNGSCMQLRPSPGLEQQKATLNSFFWISDWCNVQFPWSYQSWFMFNWNWTGLIPLSLMLVQFWSDAILNPRVDKKGADLSSGGLMHKNLSSKYGLSSLGKRKRHLTFLIWTVCFFFFLLPSYHKLAFIPFLWVLELFEVCWLVMILWG